ncbi:MAG: ACT domain-containing protein, partial [Candidatus Kryptoniota bacterium]
DIQWYGMKWGDFFSITHTPDEISIVASQNLIPEGALCEKGWRCLKVDGPLDFSLTGVLSSLANPLAQAGISIFALSTYETDYILVRQSDLEKALQTLRQEGFEVKGY